LGDLESQLRQYLNETGVIQFLLKNVYITEDRALDWRFNLKTLTEKYAEFITVVVEPGVYDGATLFLSGEKSNYIVEDDRAMIKRSEERRVGKEGRSRWWQNIHEQKRTRTLT